MNVVIDWFRWQFRISGIVIAEERGKLTWLQAFKRLFSGGVKRYPRGPTPQDFMLWQRIGKSLKHQICCVCGVHFWGWRKQRVCYKFSCWRRR